MGDYIRFLKLVDTPTLANAIELLHVRDRTEGYCDYRLRCLSPDLGTMIGYAVTATVDSTTPGPPPASRDSFISFFEALEQSPKPSVMVFQEVGSNPLLGCHAGDVMAAIGKRLGCVGIVSDSGVRDFPGVVAIGVHYFAAGHVPSHGNFTIKAVNVPVEVAGLPLRPGDLLHGDVNGLIKVPPEFRGRHSEMIDRTRADERTVIDLLESKSFEVHQLRELR